MKNTKDGNNWEVPMPAGLDERSAAEVHTVEGERKEPLVLEEVYLEKITIDGICGVY